MNDIRVLGSLVQIAWRASRWLTAAYFGSALLASAMPIAILSTQRLLVDTFLAQQGAAKLPEILVCWLALRYLLSSGDGFVRYVLHGTTLDHLLRYRMQNALSTLFARKMSSLDQGHLEDSRVQDLVAKARETFRWRTVDLLRLLAGLLMGLAAWLSALLLLLAFGPLPPVLLGLASLPRLLTGIEQGAIQWSMWGSGAPQIKRLYYLDDLLTRASAIPEIRVFRSARALLQRFEEVQRSLYDLNKAPLLRLARIQWIPALAEGAALLSIAALWLQSALSGAMSLGDYLLLLGLSEAFLASGVQAAIHAAQIRENTLFARHFFEVLALPALVPDTGTEPLPADVPPRIELKSVSFRYPGGGEVLRDVSFAIEPGQWVAIVGPNGAGKSTIVKLICRLYDPTGGLITVNGRDLRTVPLSDWHGHIGTLFQRFIDFHFTVRENVRLGRPDLDDEARLRRALSAAGADFVDALPNGIDTPLGREFDEGVELSWGQWQKLAFARAFYQDPPVLVLDEPTSAIDAESEARLFLELRERLRHRTAIVFSHRFSTVRHADLILVIEDGQVTERGNHEQLMALSGRYRAMFEAQAEGYREPRA